MTNMTLIEYRPAREFLSVVLQGLTDVNLKLALAHAVAVVDSAHKTQIAQVWGPLTGSDVRTARKTAAWAVALNVAGVGVDADAQLSAMTPMPPALYATLLAAGAAIGFALTPTQRRALWVKLGGVDDIDMPDLSDDEMGAIDFGVLLTPPPAPSAPSAQ